MCECLFLKLQLLLLLHTTFIICNSQWILPSTSVVPRADDSMAVGLYNHSIYLLGGAINGFQLVEYEILSDNFIDHGASRFDPVDLWGGSDFYTQIDTILYMISRTGKTLLAYDMKTDEFNNDNFYTIPSTVEDFSCLASRVGYLYVVGGYDYTADINLDILQVLDLTTNNWMNNVDSMQEPRVGHTCVVDTSDNTLYAISGYIWNSKNYQNTYTATIEIINTNDITQNTWSYITGQLSIALGWLRSVIYSGNIYVIGGAYGRGFDLVDIVHVIDTNTGSVSISSDLLPFSVASSAPVIVGHILYAFGGYTGSAIDSWMMYTLPQSTTTTAALTTTSNPTTTTSEATFSISTTTAPDTTSSIATTLEITTAVATTSIVSETTVEGSSSSVLRTVITETVSDVNIDFETANKEMDTSILLTISCFGGVFLGMATFCVWKWRKQSTATGGEIEEEPGAHASCSSPGEPQIVKLESVSVEIANNHGTNQEEKGNEESVSVSDTGHDSIYEEHGEHKETAGEENKREAVDGNELDNNHAVGEQHLSLPESPPLPCSPQNDHVLETPGDFNM